VITDTTPPLDTEKRVPLHFIKTELAAGVGAVTTGVSGSITFIETLSPYFKFAALVLTVMVGIPTFAYYVLAALEKWRVLVKAWKDEE
jgi:hypothetical protein